VYGYLSLKSDFGTEANRPEYLHKANKGNKEEGLPNNDEKMRSPG
jgi:hypothetical protein